METASTISMSASGNLDFQFCPMGISCTTPASTAGLADHERRLGGADAGDPRPETTPAGSCRCAIRGRAVRRASSGEQRCLGECRFAPRCGGANSPTSTCLYRRDPTRRQKASNSDASRAVGIRVAQSPSNTATFEVRHLRTRPPSIIATSITVTFDHRDMPAAACAPRRHTRGQPECRPSHEQSSRPSPRHRRRGADRRNAIAQDPGETGGGTVRSTVTSSSRRSTTWRKPRFRRSPRSRRL